MTPNKQVRSKMHSRTSSLWMGGLYLSEWRWTVNGGAVYGEGEEKEGEEGRKTGWYVK